MLVDVKLEWRGCKADTERADAKVEDEVDEIVDFIKSLLDTRVRPTLHVDGGDVEFVSFDLDTGVVVLRLYGACTSCPSSTMTMQFGIKNMLMHYIPEVKDVVPAEVDEEDDDENWGVAS